MRQTLTSIDDVSGHALNDHRNEQRDVAFSEEQRTCQECFEVVRLVPEDRVQRRMDEQIVDVSFLSKEEIAEVFRCVPQELSGPMSAATLNIAHVGSLK